MTDTNSASADEAEQTAWRMAAQTAALLAVDPFGLGGLRLRARAGPGRDAFLSALGEALTPWPLRRLPPQIGMDRLSGGLDLAASLVAGRPVERPGIFSGEPAAYLVPMAERMTVADGALLAQALDAAGEAAGRACLILLDEAASPEEAPPLALSDRMAFAPALDGLSVRRAQPALRLDPKAIRAARTQLPRVEAPDEALRALTLAAAALGVPGLRAPILALRVARASAALSGRAVVAEEDVRLAILLTLAPRRQIEPVADAAQPQQQQAPPPSDREEAAEEAQARSEDAGEAESLIEAAQAALPAGLLDRLAAAGMAARAPSRGAEAGGRSATRRAGGRRGRPLPSRRGPLDGRARIDLVATLRAAAPWQPIRRRGQFHADAPAIRVRPGDIRLRRFAERRERAILFVVDASGSAALARLSEAKGAIELLLAEAYARRDHVGLIAFRGAGAETLLPPTRALVAAKRRLAALPSGGGTPLAAGLLEALDQAERARRRGMTPGLALLTDGRANLSLSGAADRAQAAEDATDAARRIRASGIPTLAIDMAARPQPTVARLAEALGGAYMPLPHADARRLSQAASAALEGRTS